MRIGHVIGAAPLVSDANWMSGGNEGWTVATDAEGRLLWNYQEVGNGAEGRSFASAPQVLSSTAWHHIAVSFTRAGDAVTYVDGQPIGSQPILQTDEFGDYLPGSLYSGFPVVVGQDGTGTYPHDGTSSITGSALDDLGIWQRALNDDEVSRIYTFGLQGRDLERVADSVTPFVSRGTPVDGDSDSNPSGTFQAVIEDSLSDLAPASIQLYFDDQKVLPTVTLTESGAHAVSYHPPGLRPPQSDHSYTLLYSDDASPPVPHVITTFFTVGEYEDHRLPPPLFLETFDGTLELPLGEGNLPDGWRAENFSTSLTGTYDLEDKNSDAYLDWIVITAERAVAIFGPDRGWVRNWQVVNGTVLTNLMDGQFCYANSHGRFGNVYQILYSPDIDLSGRSNVFLVFNTIYTQNQDSMGAVEYSIDGGLNWQPIVYLLDGSPSGDIVRDTRGLIDAATTLAQPRQDTARYADPITGVLSDGHYGGFIGVSEDRWGELSPYISGRYNDDQTQSKRVELFRLPRADNQSTVRLRFAHSGTDSWYFGIDNVGLYALQPPAPQLTLTLSGATVYLQWTGFGILQAADDLEGGWVDVMAADTSYQIPTSAPQQFFRVIQR